MKHHPKKPPNCIGWIGVYRDDVGRLCTTCELQDHPKFCWLIMQESDIRDIVGVFPICQAASGFPSRIKNLAKDLTSAAVCVAFAFVMIMLCGALS